MLLSHYTRHGLAAGALAGELTNHLIAPSSFRLPDDGCYLPVQVSIIICAHGPQSLLAAQAELLQCLEVPIANSAGCFDTARRDEADLGFLNHLDCKLIESCDV